MSTVVVNSIEPRGGLLGISGGLYGPPNLFGVTIANNLTVSGLATFRGNATLTASEQTTVNVLNMNVLTTSAVSGQQITTGLISSKNYAQNGALYMVRKDWVDALSIGVGQTWAAFGISATNTPSTNRYGNKQFTNSTGRPIMVAITATTVAAPSFLVNGTVISSYIATNRVHPFSFIVPVGGTYEYRTTNASVNDPVWWAELR